MRYEHLVAGVSGGVASSLILHPLDLIKTRIAGILYFMLVGIYNDRYCKTHLLSFIFSVSDGQLSIRPQYTGIVHAVASIKRTEGFKGLYRGVALNVLASGATWGSYFFL